LWGSLGWGGVGWGVNERRKAAFSNEVLHWHMFVREFGLGWGRVNERRKAAFSNEVLHWHMFVREFFCFFCKSLCSVSQYAYFTSQTAMWYRLFQALLVFALSGRRESYTSAQLPDVSDHPIFLGDIRNLSLSASPTSINWYKSGALVGSQLCYDGPASQPGGMMLLLVP
jgi:hypothetical protein